MDLLRFRYHVEIENTPFTTYNCAYNKTVVVNFYDEKNKLRIQKKYGYIEKQWLYEKIKSGETINIDCGYVMDFSITEYKKEYQIPEDERVFISDFSAKRAFFDCTGAIDFSYSHFVGKGLYFEEAIFGDGDLSFHNSVFDNNTTIDFGHVYFGHGDKDFSSIKFGKGKIIFNSAKFGIGKKDFQYTEFGASVLSFTNTYFNQGDVAFVNCVFNCCKVTFKVAKFGLGKVDFHFSKFGKTDISFSRTEFGEGRVDFRTVEFGTGKLNFNRAIFGKGEITFESSEFNNTKANFKRMELGDGNVNFELIDFSEAEIDFTKTEFGKGYVSFSQAMIKILLLHSCHLDNYFDLRLKKCELIDLTDTIVRDIVDLKPSDFEINIFAIKFTGMRMIGNISIDWDINNVQQMIENQPETSHSDKAEQYRILKENFNQNGQYRAEDKSYIEYMRHDMKAELHKELQKNKWNSIIQYPYYALKWLLFDKIGLYATNPLRVLLSMLIVYLIFDIIYIFLPMVANTDIVSSLGDPDHLSGISKAVYHSAITFLTIGYGDYYPSGIIRWISSIEGFVGLFLMSYFTVAFVRKILR